MSSFFILYADPALAARLCTVEFDLISLRHPWQVISRRASTMSSLKLELAQKAAGPAPVDGDELTFAEAAKLLHMSRTYLNTLVKAGTFSGVRKTRGGQRRIPRAEVLAYKKHSVMTQTQGLDRMMEVSQRIGLYDAENREVPSTGKAYEGLTPSDRRAMLSRLIGAGSR